MLYHIAVPIFFFFLKATSCNKICSGCKDCGTSYCQSVLQQDMGMDLISNFLSKKELTEFSVDKLVVNERSQDYSDRFYELQIHLESMNFGFDEKELVDRPVKYFVTPEAVIINGIDLALKDLKILPSLRLERLTKADVDKLLDTYFYPVDFEVKPVPVQEEDAVPAKSSLYQYMFDVWNKVKAGYDKIPEANRPSFETIGLLKKFGDSALSELMKLRRKLSSSYLMAPSLKIYSTNELKQFLEKISVHLQRPSSEPNTLLNTTFNFKQSLERPHSTLIPVPYDVIVAGGRFHEFYYWDSYWMIRALAATGKKEMMLNQTYNFFSLIDRFGFVPNGARRYYLDRSQPPLFALSVSVVARYLKSFGTGEEYKNFISQALPRLLQEYLGFWMNPETSHIVDLTKTIDSSFEHMASRKTADIIYDITRRNFEYLNRYYSSLTVERPESYLADRAILNNQKQKDAKQPVRSPELFPNEPINKSIPEIMRAIRAAAESGWDFSSRWNRLYIEGKENQLSSVVNRNKFFTDLDTTNVVPVDLNAMLYSSEKIIHNFIKELPEIDNANVKYLKDTFALLAQKRNDTMVKYKMINDTHYLDYDFRKKKISNVVSGAHIIANGIFNTTKPVPSGLVSEAGIATTIYNTGEQWDYPNAWSPVQTFLPDSDTYPWDPKYVTFTGYPHYGPLQIAFLKSIYTAYEHNVAGKAPGLFYEKYHCEKSGVGGAGGEYTNQVGFGWTNGFVIEAISRGVFFSK